MNRRYCVFGTCILLYGFLLRPSSQSESKDDEPPDYRFTTYEDLTKQVAFFRHKDVVGYVQMAIDVPRHQIILGGRNCLFRLSLDSLAMLEMADWKSDAGTKALCKAKGQSEENCQNFIRVLLIHKDQIFTCGTNAFSPECTWRPISNLKSIVHKVDGKAKCPFSPEHNSTSLMTHDGDYYSATMMDITARDPAIYRVMGPSPHLRTVQYNSKWLNEPNFVSSYEIGDEVYFFFREAAVEYMNCGKKIYSRVARLCKTDGGGKFLLEDNWTTFLKARLNCSLPGDYPFYFDEIQSTFFMKKENVIYAIFSTQSNGIAGSAVCVFNMSLFQEAFKGAFRYQQDSNSAWMRTDSTADTTTQCDAAKSSVKRSFEQYAVRHLVEAQKYQLMDQAVQPNEINPVVHNVGERWSHLVVEHVLGRHHKTFEVVFLATEDGTIKKMVKLPGAKTSCLIEEIKVVPNGDKMPIKALKISPEMTSLYVATTHEVLKIPVERCKRFKNREMCHNAMDPYCGWNTFVQECTTAPSGNPHVHYWHQNITSCPIMYYSVHGRWSDWSSWTPCQQVGSEKSGDYCFCRTRSCDKPKPRKQGRACHGLAIEVTNCTTHGQWTDWSAWSSCSQTCGDAIRSRWRQCGNPPPKYGGRVCVGNDRDEEYCAGNPSCPLPPMHGNWTLWSAWTECTTNCNGGIQTRRRSCDIPLPTRRGVPCNGNKQEWRMCNTQTCDAQTKITPWSPWVKTNVTRGGHFEQRFRFMCKANVPDSSMIKARHYKSDVRFCFDNAGGCFNSDISLVEDIDGKWSPWSNWTVCTADCDGGTQWTVRTCDNPLPSGYGKDCEGHRVERRECNSQSCRGVWTCWSDFTVCSATCGDGVRYRTRHCVSSVEGTTINIPCSGESQEQLPCTREPCADLHGWDLWTTWTMCGEQGAQSRKRQCKMESDAECIVGDRIQIRACSYNSIDVNIGEVSQRGSSEGRIDVMHLVIVGTIAFLMGGVIFVGIFMYVLRYRKLKLDASERRKNQKNELNKNQILSDNQLAMDFMNLNNKTFGGGTLTRDKMTVNEATATLKRNSVMRTNLAINDL